MEEGTLNDEPRPCTKERAKVLSCLYSLTRIVVIAIGGIWYFVYSDDRLKPAGICIIKFRLGIDITLIGTWGRLLIDQEQIIRRIFKKKVCGVVYLIDHKEGRAGISPYKKVIHPSTKTQTLFSSKDHSEGNRNIPISIVEQAARSIIKVRIAQLGRVVRLPCVAGSNPGPDQKESIIRDGMKTFSIQRLPETAWFDQLFSGCSNQFPENQDLANTNTETSS